MDWKKFFYYFRFYFIAIAVLAAVLAFRMLGKDGAEYVRANDKCTTAERVFDYADVLSEEEENKLRELIARSEQETGCDIVLVTLNQSLKDYAKGYEERLGYLEPYQYVMVYADNFYDEHYFGFNKAQGDGVLLLDNWYREEDGRIYSWLSTCGRAEERFSSGMIDSLLEDALRNVDSDPYGAYSRYVKLFAAQMTGDKLHIPVWAVLLVSAVATGAYVLGHLSANKGRKTVNERTYVTSGTGTRMKRQEDIFLRRSVSKRRIETNNGNGSGGGGGGGGHHVSSGGVSHGGGGHSR